MQEQPPANLKFPTWRVELMDENNQPTDIWAECWNTGSGWKVDYLQILTLDLTDALCVCYRSLLDYLRDGRPLDAKFN
jgi:hypothetical protein